MRLSRLTPRVTAARAGSSACIVAWLCRLDRDTGGLTPVGGILDFGTQRSPDRPLFGPLPCGSALDDTGQEIRGPRALADEDVAADADAPWDDCPLAYDGDASVESSRLATIDNLKIGTLADYGTGTDRHFLVQNGPVHDRTRPDHGVKQDDRVAHAGAHVHHHARREHGVDNGAVDHAAVADQAAMNLSRGADLGRCSLLGPGMDDPFTVVQVQFRRVG